MDELTADAKAAMDDAARRKMNFMEVEYWRVRNGKSRYMRCPYCKTDAEKDYRSNFVDGETVCCALFAKAFQAVMDRQDEVDKAAMHARNIVTLCQMVEGRPN